MKFFQTKNIKYILGFIICTLTAFIGIRTEFTLGPISDKAVIELQQEYSRLSIMPDSFFYKSQAFHKSTAVTFVYFFETNKSSDEIKQYYLDEVRKNQWIVVSVSNDTIYCTKADYKLWVVFKNPNIAGQYHINLGWPPRTINF